MGFQAHWGALVVACTVGLLLGCSGSSVDGEGAPLSVRSQQIKLNDTGGGLEPCPLGGDQYSFETATRNLDFAYCDYSVSPSVSVTGARVLSTAEADSIAQTLDKVRESSAKNCGADASVVTLDATTASGVERYADDFYSGCPFDALAGRTFVTGLPDLSVTLGQLARAKASQD